MTKKAKKLASKPDFACKLYPKCPDRQESTRVVVDEADEEERISEITSMCWHDVSGPCKESCYEKKMAEPINHTVISIIHGRVVDIGS
jgi:hypothetical protein